VVYDCVILGGGVAGVSAACYAHDLGLNCILIEEFALGGKVVNIAEIENYPGAGRIKGLEFADNLDQDITSRNIPVIQESVMDLSKQNNLFQIKLSQKTVSAMSVILASGGKSKDLALDAIPLLRGKGISDCATCDAPMFRDKAVMVLGGGDAACEEALFLTKFASSVTLVVRSSALKAQKSLTKKINLEEKINVLYNTQIKDLETTKSEYGFETLSSVELDGENSSKLAISALFLAIGTEPRLEFIDTKLLEHLNQDPNTGRVLSNESMATSIPGLFVAGEIRKMPFYQLIVAASDGAIAAYSALNYCDSLKSIENN
jgi:thioredoxin reductase (NADPH)